MLIHLLAFLCNSRPLTGLIHPIKGTSTQPNSPSNKSLESAATVLHPLPKKLQESAQEIQFHSARESKAAKKDDPFAEQNAKRAEKLKTKVKRRKRIIVIGSIVGGAAVISAVVIAIIFSLTKLDSEESEANETITDYNTIQNESQQAFDSSDKSAPEIANYYKDLINKTTSNAEKATLHISEISSLAQNGFVGEAIDAATDFELSSYWQSANQTQLSIYYGVLINIYSSLNDNERMEYYINLLQQTDFKPDTEVVG